MPVERLTVSLDAELAAAVREAADEDALNMSAWLADAASRPEGLPMSSPNGKP